MWKLKDIRQLTIDEILLFIYGFIGTMPIISIGGKTAWVYLTLLVVMWNIMILFTDKELKITYSQTATPLVVITIFTLISAFCCIMGDMPAVWINSQSNKIILEICYLLIFILYAGKDRIHLLKNYVKGVYYASIIHMLWAYAQLVVKTVSTSTLNEIVFVKLLHMASPDTSVEVAEHLPGLCWHSSNMAPLMVFGFAMSKSPVLKLGFIGISIACGSRTTTLGVFVCAAIQIARFIYKHRGKYNVPARLAQIGVIVIAMFLIAFSFTDAAKHYVTMLTGAFERFMGTFGGDQGSAGMHASYWTSVFDVINMSSIANVLIGYGIDCSGYVFSVLFGYYEGSQWVCEADTINLLWSYGFIGVSLRYFWYVFCIGRCRKADSRYLDFFIPLLLMGITYNVMYNWCLILMYSLFLLGNEKIKFKETIREDAA
ncbi:MAG: hypothetical protein IIX45_09335 [Lachnospiraceae bacterium]|nr:hypothetical protein [Lachnospiraceae bacterium]